jgi:hypothetical protein
MKEGQSSNAITTEQCSNKGMVVVVVVIYVVVGYCLSCRELTV